MSEDPKGDSLDRLRELVGEDGLRLLAQHPHRVAATLGSIRAGSTYDTQAQLIGVAEEMLQLHLREARVRARKLVQAFSRGCPLCKAPLRIHFSTRMPEEVRAWLTAHEAETHFLPLEDSEAILADKGAEAL